MPRAHKPTQGSIFSIRAYGNYRIPDPPRKLEDMDPEARAWVIENNRYVKAGAGKRTKAGLCLGYDDKVLCTKNARSSHNSYCRDHQAKFAGTLPPRHLGTPRIPAANRKLTMAQACQIREQRRKRNYSYAQLGRMYQLSPAGVRNIVRGRTYKRIPFGIRNENW